MDLKGTQGIVYGLVLFAVLGSVLSGYCNVEYACKKKCEKTFPFLELFGIHWTYTTTCDAQCSKKACCTGYTGPNCTQRTEECQQKGVCSGHKCVEQYTDGCMCNKEEKMSEKFMGKDTRTVRVPCDHPCERTSCCSGYTGKDCNEEVQNTFLSATELESVKKQLKTDEGYKEEIYEDSEGNLTFGIGHLIRKTDEEYEKPVGTKVSTERVHEAFKADVHIASGDVTKVFPRATSFPREVKEILVNMMFNLGRTRLKKFKKFIAAVNSGDWKTAAEEMEDSLWFRQVGNRAVRLVNRMEAVTTKIGEESNDGVSSDLTASGLTQLYNSRVQMAEYMTRPLDSGGSSSSSSGRRKRGWWFRNYALEHAGVRVTLTDGSEWLIHKGGDFGDVSTTVITSASHMSSRWTMEECKMVNGYYTVDDLMRAALIDESYNVVNFQGANCQKAAHGIFDLLTTFDECPP